PQVHYIEYPLPPKVRCLKCAKCFGDERVGKVKGEYNDLPYLSKHLKKYHPGDTISYRCSKCNYKSKGTKCHMSLAVDAAGQSTRGSLGECNSVGQLTTSGAAKAISRLAETVGGPDKRQATTSVQQLTLPFTAAPSQAANEARAQGRTSTTPTSRSPSYAAVTAGPSTRSTSSTTARSKTIAKSAAPNTTTREARRSGEAVTTRKSPMTAMVSKPRVVSVEVVKLPVKTIQKAGVQNAAKPARAPSHPPPPPPQRTSSEAGWKVTTNDQPVSSKTRRATSVPVEKSNDTTRWEHVSPHPPRIKGTHILISSSSDEEGTPFQPGSVGRQSVRRKKVTGPPPTTTSNEGAVTRSRRSTSAPVESAVDARLTALDRPSSRATGNTTSPITEGLNPLTSTSFTGGMGRQITPPLCLPQRNILPTIEEEMTSP
ncbi:hypothetical protein ALC57_03026, partial [Trachymyrmex cornetzi]